MNGFGNDGLLKMMENTKNEENRTEQNRSGFWQCGFDDNYVCIDVT